MVYEVYQHWKTLGRFREEEHAQKFLSERVPADAERVSGIREVHRRLEDFPREVGEDTGCGYFIRDNDGEFIATIQYIDDAKWCLYNIV